MKKYAALICTIITIFCVNGFAQDQTHQIQVNSISISTSRSEIYSNFGSFSINATDENGGEFTRNAVYGYFSSAFANCIPCDKGSTFGGFRSARWLTGGGTQTPGEWTRLDELQISVPAWTLPVQSPRNRPLVKYIPVTVRGKLSVVDNRPQTFQIINTDDNVSLTGVMRVEFKQLRADPRKFEWLSVQITANRTP